MLLACCEFSGSQFDEARTKALQNPDPFQAYLQLNKVRMKTAPTDCSDHIMREYHDLASSLYRSALKRH